MSQAKGIRLWLRPARGNRAAVWIIRDGSGQKSTGCGGRDLEGAERKLEAYLRSIHTPRKDGGRDLSEIPVSDVVVLYGQEIAPDHARPTETLRRLRFINRYFGGKMLSEVTRSSCVAYASHRQALQAARRELTDFRSAVNHYFKDEVIAPTVHFELPANSIPRERWLTIKEAARLLRAAWRHSARQPKGGMRYYGRHVARFILTALYTGTRSGAVCGAAIRPTAGRGYVDLDQGVFYRRPPGSKQTSKRQPSIRLPDKLLAHMRRWERLGLSKHAVVEWEGEPVAKVSKAFRRIADAAGLHDVSPHILRHTAITWSLQNGVSTRDASEYFGVSEKVIIETYGHHSPDHQTRVTKRMDRRKGHDA